MQIITRPSYWEKTSHGLDHAPEESPFTVGSVEGLTGGVVHIDKSATPGEGAVPGVPWAVAAGSDETGSETEGASRETAPEWLSEVEEPAEDPEGGSG